MRQRCQRDEAGAGGALVKRAIDAAMAGETEPESPPTPTGDDEHDGKFSMTESGLYRNKNKKWNWIAQPFEVLGLARNMVIESGSSSESGKLVRFRNRDGQTCEEIIPDGALHSNLNELIKYLAGCGMNIKGTLPARGAFAEYLLSVKAADPILVINNTGWIEMKDGLAFTRPGEVIGAAVTERVVLAKNSGAPYSQKGTLAEWRNAAAVPAGKHLMLRFAIS